MFSHKRVRCAPFAHDIACVTAPPPADRSRENNYAPERSAGASTGSIRRKTRESDGTDSLWRHVPRPLGKPAASPRAEIFAAV